MTKYVTHEMLEQIAELTVPRMKAVHDSVAASFPEHHADAMYIITLAFHLATLLEQLPADERPPAVDLLNLLLAKFGGYKLVAVS